MHQLHLKPGPTAWPSPLCFPKPSASQGCPITTALGLLGSIHPLSLPPLIPFTTQQGKFSSVGDLGGSMLGPEQRERGRWRSCIFWMERPNAHRGASEIVLNHRLCFQTSLKHVFPWFPRQSSRHEPEPMQSMARRCSRACSMRSSGTFPSSPSLCGSSEGQQCYLDVNCSSKECLKKPSGLGIGTQLTKTIEKY